MKNMVSIAVLALFFAATVSSSSIAAESASAIKDGFDKAVATYLKDDYKGSLPLFQGVAKSDPKYPKVHYYLALCYQQLDDDKNAAAEYELALAQSKEPAFKEIVAERLLRTKRRLGLAPKLSSEEQAPSLGKHDPVKKVIWFSTNWCSHCKKFKTAWEAGKEKYTGKLNFEHVNAEDPSAWKTVETYKPKAYPTLVYLDAKNKVIENFAAAPSSDEFIKHLQELGAQ